MFWPCFVMLLYVVAQKVWWFSVLTLFWDVIVFVAQKVLLFVLWPCFVMFMFVVAQKVWLLSLLTWFCDVIICCCSKIVMVLSFDLILWWSCFFLLTFGDCLVFWPCFVMLLFVVAHKVCDGLVFWLVFSLMSVVDFKVWWISVLTWFSVVTVCCCSKCDCLVFWHGFVMLLFVVAQKWFWVLRCSETYDN